MVLFQLRKGQVKESQVLNILSQYSYDTFYSLQHQLRDNFPLQPCVQQVHILQGGGSLTYQLGVNLVQLVLVEIKCLEPLLMAINKEVIRSQVMLVQDRTKTCMLSQPH